MKEIRFEDEQSLVSYLRTGQDSASWYRPISKIQQVLLFSSLHTLGEYIS